MQNSDPRDRIVYPIHKLMIDSYNINHIMHYQYLLSLCSVIVLFEALILKVLTSVTLALNILEIFVMHTQAMSLSLHSIIKANFSFTILLKKKDGTISNALQECSRHVVEGTSISLQLCQRNVLS